MTHAKAGPASADRLRRAYRGAYTLTEVLIAGAIMAASATAALQTLSLVRRSIQMSQRQSEALHRARARLEELGLLDFHHALLSVGRHSFAGGHYDVALVSPREKDIEVRAQWLGANGRTNWVVLTTTFSKPLHP